MRMACTVMHVAGAAHATPVLEGAVNLGAGLGDGDAGAVRVGEALVVGVGLPEGEAPVDSEAVGVAVMLRVVEGLGVGGMQEVMVTLAA